MVIFARHRTWRRFCTARAVGLQLTFLLPICKRALHFGPLPVHIPGASNRTQTSAGSRYDSSKRLNAVKLLRGQPGLLPCCSFFPAGACSRD